MRRMQQPIWLRLSADRLMATCTDLECSATRQPAMPLCAFNEETCVKALLSPADSRVLGTLVI